MKNRRTVLTELLPAAIFGVLVLIQAGVYVLALPYLFIERWLRKQPFSEIGFRAKDIGKNALKYWWLLLLPVGAAAGSLFLSRWIVPGFWSYVLERTQPMLAFDKLPILLSQLLILSLAEEIAFRAFLQRKLAIAINPVVAIVATSLVFALGHWGAGSSAIIVYDLSWIFIDSLIYGAIFHKTQSVYLSWTSHFLANLCGIALLLFV